MERRDFLIALGIGTSAVVSGYYILRPRENAGDEPGIPSSDRPQLKDKVGRSRSDEMLRLDCDGATFYVNETGREIISRMDGRNSVTDIASGLAGHFNIGYSDSVVASVATFIARLGEAGFLASPFYAVLYGSYS